MTPEREPVPDRGWSWGAARSVRIYCDACESARDPGGSRQLARYLLCGACAAEYDAARTNGAVATLGQYIRDKRFGEGEKYGPPS